MVKTIDKMEEWKNGEWKWIIILLLKKKTLGYVDSSPTHAPKRNGYY
jgi:hypothetical protein